MKVTMKSSELWKNCIGAVSKLIERTSFTFTPEGVRMKAMDPSHIALVDFELSAEGFDEYDVSETKVVGTDLKKMNEILARAKKGDEFSMSLQEDEGLWVLTFKGTSTRRFTLPLMEIEDEELPEPELDFTASAKVLAESIQDGLKDASVVSDSVCFELSEGVFQIYAESEAGRAEMSLSEGDEGLLEFHVDSPARARFSIGYLDNITKAASSGSVAEIHLGTDLPIRLNFPMAEDKGRLEFLLAPRIESE